MAPRPAPPRATTADFDDFDAPSRRVVDSPIGRGPQRRSAAEEEDDFGDLNEPSRAFPARHRQATPPVEPDAPTIKRRVDSAAVGAAIDRSGLGAGPRGHAPPRRRRARCRRRRWPRWAAGTCRR